MGRFCWQEGFGAFSYGHSQLKGIIDYVATRNAVLIMPRERAQDVKTFIPPKR